MWNIIKKLLGFEQKERKAEAVKQNAIDQMKSTAHDIRGSKLEMQRTTTYYIGRAIGAIK